MLTSHSSTPGSAASSASIRSNSCASARACSRSAPGEMPNVDDVVGVEAEIHAADVRSGSCVKSPADTSSAIESAICAVASVGAEPRRRSRPDGWPAWFLSDAIRSRTRAVQRGKRPKSSPVPSASTRGKQHHRRIERGLHRSCRRRRAGATASGAASSARPAVLPRAPNAASRQRFGEELRDQLTPRWRRATAEPPFRACAPPIARAAGWRCSRTRSAARTR